jgi:hypothetical protein
MQAYPTPPTDRLPTLVCLVLIAFGSVGAWGLVLGAIHLAWLF